MNPTTLLISEATESIFSGEKGMSIFDDLLLENLLCQNTLLELLPEQLLQ